jgi:CheY-like chemotaxis protein
MKPAKIVLIEDNPGDVLLVEMALEENDVACEITRFTDGEEALRWLCATDESASNGLRPDIILLDLNTPKSDGFAVLKQLKETPHLAGVPVAVVTSSRAQTDKRRAELLGASRYVEKPSELDEFLSEVGQAVKEVLQGAKENTPSLS